MNKKPPKRLLLSLACCAPLAIGLVAAIWVAVKNANGTFVLSTRLSAVLIALGALVSLTVWLTTMLRTSRKRQLAESFASGAQLERDAHRRFLARLDHELKNPVTAIRAALEAAPKQSPALRVAAGQADRLAQLIGELRSLSALETAEIERMPVDLAAVVRDEVEGFSADLSVRGSVRHLDVQLPSAPWPLPIVLGDADLLAVAVRNLLVNAAKYSDAYARIEVRGSEDLGFVVIEVADTGWGIPQSDLPQVWEELWRSSTARKVEGSGLGLSLVRVVAERHGGTVAIRSREGSGTSVRFRLPIAPPTASARL